MKKHLLVALFAFAIGWFLSSSLQTPSGESTEVALEPLNSLRTLQAG